MSVYFLSTRPTPEVAKALEAEYRETLLRKADEAIYARRAAAVDEERKIKEKELSSDRALEEQRRELIVLQGENAKQEAENRGRALELESQYRAKAVRATKPVVAGREGPDDPVVRLADTPPPAAAERRRFRGRR